MILADLGADVVKVEPGPAGDNSRRLTGAAIGFFPTYNRNKRSICVDMKGPSGAALVRRLAASADVIIENFRPGAMEKLGLGYSGTIRNQSASCLLLAQGLPAWALRASHGSR